MLYSLIIHVSMLSTERERRGVERRKEGKKKVQKEEQSLGFFTMSAGYLGRNICAPTNPVQFIALNVLLTETHRGIK